MKTVLGIIGLCITLPMWYWLFYQILVSVNATPTMWLVFWLHFPISVVLSICITLYE